LPKREQITSSSSFLLNFLLFPGFDLIVVKPFVAAVAADDVVRIPRRLPEEQLQENVRVALRHFGKLLHYVLGKLDQLLFTTKKSKSS
jgi:hypothetical protein